MTNFILLLFSLARKNTWECPPQILGVYLPGGLQSVESNKKKNSPIHWNVKIQIQKLFVIARSSFLIKW